MTGLIDQLKDTVALLDDGADLMILVDRVCKKMKMVPGKSDITLQKNIQAMAMPLKPSKHSCLLWLSSWGYRRCTEYAWRKTLHPGMSSISAGSDLFKSVTISVRSVIYTKAYGVQPMYLKNNTSHIKGRKSRG